MKAEKKKAARVPVAKVVELLSTDVASNVDASTLFNLCDVTGYSGRWFIRDQGPPTVRISVSPDESWLIDAYRRLSQAAQEKFSNTLKRALLRQ